MHGVDLRAPTIPEDWHGFSTGALESIGIEKLLAERRFKYCFHLAGAASVPASMEDPLGDFSALIPGTAKLLCALSKCKDPPVLVLFSSAAVYGAPTSVPVVEKHTRSPVSPYGIHKVLAEEMSIAYARLYGLNIIILRIFSAFGAGLRKQLFWDISIKFQRAIALGNPFIVLGGDGNETRDFIHADDVALAALATCTVAEANPGIHIYNLGSGEETNIRIAAKTLLQATGYPLEIHFSGKLRPGDPPRWRADISLLKATGFKPTVKLSQGLLAYNNWFQSIPVKDLL
jgi:UDP-glucose 4-epimerase